MEIKPIDYRCTFALEFLPFFPGRMAVMLQAIAIAGLFISLYAVYVEHKMEEDSSYEAICDVSEHISCSRVLTSEWGHLLSHFGILPRGHPLDFANANLGVIYFSFVFLHRLLPLSSYKTKAGVVFAITVPVMAVSLYLAYILFATLKDLCLVCMSIYILNLAVLVVSYKSLKDTDHAATTKTQHLKAS